MSNHAFPVPSRAIARGLALCGAVAALLALAHVEALAAQSDPDGVVVEHVTYGGDGITLPGILARPADPEGRVPGILALHGGGNSGLQRAMEWLVVRLAQRGYVALSGTYRPPTMERDDLADSRMGVDYLTSLPYVDGTRIGMTGQSRGAGSTYRLGAADDRVKSLVPIAGTSAAVAGLANRGGADRKALSEQRFMEGIRGAGGFPHELPAESGDRSPTPNMLEMDKPVLIIQGTWDLHAPAEGAIAVKREAARQGASHVKVNLVPGMGHFFDTPKGDLLDEIGTLAADWYDETLWDRETGRDFEKPLELPDAPVWPEALRASVREITYRADGATVPGYLIEPAGGGNGRGVVYAPGGHTGAEATRLGFVIEALAGDGNVVLVTRYRGEVGEVTDDADVAGALDYLGGVAGVDARSLSVVGHGRGGMAALRSAAKDDRITAVVAMGAPANLTRLIQGLEAYSPAAARFQASRFAGPSSYPALSPHYYSRDIRVPVLLVHGTLDLMVAPEHMLWNGVGLMTTGNTDVELYMPPWDIHHFDSPFAWLKPEQWVGRVTAFLDRKAGSAQATEAPDAP